MSLARILLTAILLCGLGATHDAAALPFEETVVSETIIDSPKDYAHTPWAELKIPSGTKLIARKSQNGSILYTLKYPVGVTMEQTEYGFLNLDTTGGGAVLCLWEITSILNVYIDKCHPEELKIRDYLDRTIEKLKIFIIANSLRSLSGDRVSRADLDAALQRKRDELPAECTGPYEDFAQILLRQKSDVEKMDRDVDESLAVPRPPVTAPCL